MSDSEFLLSLLQQAPHSKEAIEFKSLAQRGKSMTVHSRVAELRDEGWVIERKFQDGEHYYTLIGKENGIDLFAKKATHPSPVAGYIFNGGGKNHGKVCQIIDRGEIQEDTLTCQFIVRFTNKDEEEAWASDLEPWYPAG